MITLFDYLVEMERHRDEMMRAERHRLARQSGRRDSLLARVSRPLLVRLGRLLVAWGSQLQARATARSSISVRTDQRQASPAQ